MVKITKQDYDKTIRSRKVMSILQSGRFRLYLPLCEVLGLSSGDSVIFHKDELNKVYVSKLNEDEDAIKLTSKDRFSLGFRRSNLAVYVKETLGVNPTEKLDLLIAPQPIIEGVYELKPI